MPVAHHTRSMSSPVLRHRRARKISLSPRLLSLPLTKRRMLAAGCHRNRDPDPVFRAMAVVADAADEDGVEDRDHIAPPVPRSPGSAGGADHAPDAFVAVDEEIDDPELLAPPVPRVLLLQFPRAPVQVVAPQPDGNAHNDAVNLAPAFDGDDASSQFTYDSVDSILHLSIFTPHGRIAWNHYDATSRYMNHLPPYFHV